MDENVVIIFSVGLYYFCDLLVGKFLFVSRKQEYHVYEFFWACPFFFAKLFFFFRVGL